MYYLAFKNACRSFSLSSIRLPRRSWVMPLSMRWVLVFSLSHFTNSLQSLSRCGGKRLSSLERIRMSMISFGEILVVTRHSCDGIHSLHVFSSSFGSLVAAMIKRGSFSPASDRSHFFQLSGLPAHNSGRGTFPRLAARFFLMIHWIFFTFWACHSIFSSFFLSLYLA